MLSKLNVVKASPLLGILNSTTLMASEAVPLNSTAREVMRKAFIGDANWTFDNDVKVNLPDDEERYFEN